MPLTVGVELSPRDREELLSWTRSPSMRAGLAQRAQGRAAGRRRGGHGRDRAPGRVEQAGGDRLEAPVRRGGCRRVGRPAQVRAPGAIDPVAHRAGDAGAAAGEAGCHALVEPTVGPASGRQRLHGVHDVEEVGSAAVAGARRSSSPPTRELEAKIRDVVGLYLNPPDKAIVLCVDEKSQVQALDRTAPVLPLRLGVPEKQTHDYVRHGTTTLFAALEVATGKVTDACYPRHRHEEFLRFLKQVAKTYPRRRAAHRVRQLRHPQAPGGDQAGWPRTRGSRCTSPRPPGPG